MRIINIVLLLSMSACATGFQILAAVGDGMAASGPQPTVICESVEYSTGYATGVRTVCK